MGEPESQLQGSLCLTPARCLAGRASWVGQGQGPGLRAPSSPTSSAFPLPGLHPGLPGRKLAAVGVQATAACAPRQLAISLRESLVSKAQSREDSRLPGQRKFQSEPAAQVPGGRGGNGTARRRQPPGHSWATADSGTSLSAHPKPTTRPWAGWPFCAGGCWGRAESLAGDLLLGGLRNACALDAGRDEGLAGSEPGETQGSARGGRRGGSGRPVDSAALRSASGPLPASGAAPAHRGCRASRRPRRGGATRHPPKLELADSSLPFQATAVVPRTPAWPRLHFGTSQAGVDEVNTFMEKPRG